jgi:hypothetical protein
MLPLYLAYMETFILFKQRKRYPPGRDVLYTMLSRFIEHLVMLTILFRNFGNRGRYAQSEPKLCLRVYYEFNADLLGRKGHRYKSGHMQHLRTAIWES